MNHKPLIPALIAISLVSCRKTENKASELPNYIIILADDLGYNDIGCFGSKTIKTPNLDRLAAEGMKLKDFHSNCSVCSPTRAALMTGRYQHRTGIVNVLGQTSAALPQVQGLPKGTVTIAEVLKEAGYQTAMFGKWHLGDFAEHHPLDFGFEYYFGAEAGMGNPFTYLPAKAGPGTKSMIYRNREIENGPGRYYTYRLADEAIDYLDKRDRNKPFFIYMPFTAPHLPLFKPGDSLAVWDGNVLGPHPGDLEAAYRETIEALDLAVGNIVQYLILSGLQENTMILFTSDNGPVDVGSCKPFTGRKTNLYEGGTRVPTIAWWPGRIGKGQESNELIATMDVFPTLAKLSGIRQKKELNIDGLDFSKVLLEQGKMPERMVFWEKPTGVHMRQFDIRREAVRYGSWKLLRDRSGTELKLFNLESDTAEQLDLSAKYPDLVDKMYSAFTEWKNEVYSEAPLNLEEMILYLKDNGVIREK